MSAHNIEAWQEIPLNLNVYTSEEGAKLVFHRHDQQRAVFIVNLDGVSCEELMSVLNEALPEPKRWTPPEGDHA